MIVHVASLLSGIHRGLLYLKGGKKRTITSAPGLHNPTTGKNIPNTSRNAGATRLEPVEVEVEDKEAPVVIPERLAAARRSGAR